MSVLTAGSPAANEVSPERVLRNVYAEFRETALARDWPVDESNQIEFDYRVKTFAMAIPYLSRPQGVVFDIGTGGGIAPRFFKALGCRVMSVDSASASGTAALENVRLAGVEAASCDIEADPLPMPDGSTDVVLFMDVIEHLHHSPKPALEEMMRILRPGGVVIASTPNSTRLTVRLKMLAGYSNWPQVWSYFDVPRSHYLHHHEYTIEEFRGVFERTGFTVERFCLDEWHSLTGSLEGLNGRSAGKTAGRGRARLGVNLGRRAIWACAKLAPRLRSSMTLVARKPLS